MHHSFIARLIAVLFLVVAAAACRQDADPNRGEPNRGEPSPAEPESPPATDSSEAADGTAAENQREAAQANHLARETSPYLLQHAHNPVDWFPWGEEALAKAAAENKLIFLSIGYSSCHWCHVMERESFTDESIAQFLNDHFVCIKVDREERPDVDDVYMTALQVYLQSTGAGGGGGWPLSMFLTPEALPTIGGTYMPPAQFLRASKQVDQLWRESPDQLNKIGAAMASTVRRILDQPAALEVPPLDSAAATGVKTALTEQFDPEYAGFGYSPGARNLQKFPEPSNLAYLLDRGRRRDDEAAEAMVLATLRAIAAGGLRDHVGGGFHRYSTDRFWTVPHFEKMLYDNAQLIGLFAAAFERTGEPEFRVAAIEAIKFLVRELRDDSGGFYSALDADAAGAEGSYYVYAAEEIRNTLTDTELNAFSATYAVDLTPNFEEGTIIPRRDWIVDELRSSPIDPGDEAMLKSALAKLLALRDGRERPGVDVKMLTAWNGLAIRGLADAARAFDDDEALELAQGAAEFVLANLRDEQGRLFRTFTSGEAKLAGYLDDYALLVDGLIALHQATGESRWLDEAVAVADVQIEFFEDADRGGFYFTASDADQLFARGKSPFDGPLPSGAATTASNLIYLAAAADRPDFAAKAEATLKTLVSRLLEVPAALPQSAIALEKWLGRE